MSMRAEREIFEAKRNITQHTAGKTSFFGRLTTTRLLEIPKAMSQTEAQNPSTAARHQRVETHLTRFAGDARRLAAAWAITLRPSTAATYLVTLRARRPELRRPLFPYTRWAQLAMQTPWGRVTSATHLSIAQIRALIAQAPHPARAALIFMWATASRAADLKHAKTETVHGHLRITFATVEGASRYDLRP